ncbi:MAG: hypothetical protein LBP23_00120 [Treponema sp.]|jgi:hypothetical protein|nr:hypothetical protein [Treponema sp.]
MLRRVWAVLWAAVCFFSAAAVFPQDENTAAGAPGPAPAASGAATIPEALRRPRRGEAGRYPVDTVIGPLGAGEAGEDAYRFAGELLGALVAGNRGAPALSTVENGTLDTILEDLAEIGPLSCRLGGGREEADGAVSFLVRFIGREKGISGELYIRAGDAGAAADAPAAAISPPQAEDGPAAAEDKAGAGNVPAAGKEPAGGISPAAAEGSAETAGAGGGKNAGKAAWRFDDLVLEEPGDRGAPAVEGRFDFVPYERFF